VPPIAENVHVDDVSGSEQICATSIVAPCEACESARRNVSGSRAVVGISYDSGRRFATRP